MREPYVAEILAQPDALQAVLDRRLDRQVASLVDLPHRFDRIVTTGMGSSLHALHPTFLRLVQHGLPVWNVETAELLAVAEGLLTPRTLLWITSQSGESAEVVALLGRLGRQRPAILGSTSNLDSRLAGAADAVVDLGAQGERTVSAQSYLNTLALSGFVADTMLGTEPDPQVLGAPEALAAYLADWDDHVAAMDGAVGAGSMFVVGRGTSLAAARTGALIIKEAAKTAVEAMSAPQFRHGPLEMAGPEVTVVLLEGEDRVREANERTVSDLRATGAAVVCVAPGGTGPGAAPSLDSTGALPLAEFPPLQALSVALARRRGVEPGAFGRISKVTTTL